MLSVPPDGMSLETHIVRSTTELSPSIVIVSEAALVAGQANFKTLSRPVGGKIHGSVPVIGMASNLHQTWLPELKTGIQVIIPATSLPYIDTNQWEEAFFGHPLVLGRILFVMATFAEWIHVTVRIIQSFKRQLHMRVIPMTLESSRPIALWSSLIGSTGRLLYMLIDPMLAQFRISSSLSGIFGVFGVPWTIVSAVITIAAWAYMIRRNLKADAKLLMKYQIVGLVYAGIVILLSFVSAVIDAGHFNSLIAFSQIYFLVYCVSQVVVAVAVVVVLIRLHVVMKWSSAKTGNEMSSTRKRLYIRGAFFIVSAILVLFTFVLLSSPIVVFYPIPYIIDATAIAWALALCSAAGIELFDYRPKSKRNSTSNSCTLSSGFSTTARTRNTSAFMTLSGDTDSSVVIILK